MTYEQVCNLCLAPRLILSSRLRVNVFKFSHIRFFDTSYPITEYHRKHICDGDISPYTLFRLPHLPRGSYQVDHILFYDPSTGEVAPVYEYVCCGHCAACSYNKQSDYIQRVKFAANSYNFPPAFVTLTFNDPAYKALDPDKVLRPFQLFMKRLRKHLSDNELKYIVVPERNHGPESRLHYHVLLFGLPRFKDDPNFNSLYTIHLLEYAYRSNRNGFGSMSFDQYRKTYPLVLRRPAGYDPQSFGYINYSLLNNAQTAVNYIFKYITKNGYRPYCSSNLGLGYARTLRKAALDSKDGIIYYRPLGSNFPVKIALSKYFINKLFPTVSMQLPVKFYSDFYTMFNETQRILYSKFYHKQTKRGFQFLQHYFLTKFPFVDVDLCLRPSDYGYELESSLLSSHVGESYSLGILEDSVRRLSSYDVYFPDLLRMESDRMSYLSKFSDHQRSALSRALDYQKHLGRSRALSKL